MSKRRSTSADGTPQPGATSGGDRWRFALDHGAQGLWDWNLDGSVVYCSDNLLSMLGIEGGHELSFADWVGRVQADQRGDLLVGLEGLLAGVPEYEGEHRIRSGAAAWKWMRVRGRVFARNAAGRPSRVVGTCVDIDADKAVEAALQESEERLRHVVSRIPGVVFEFVLRSDGTFGMPYSSPGLHKLLRVTPDEIRQDGSVAFRYLDPDYREHVFRSIMDSARDLTHWSEELPQIFPDGERRWVRAESMPERQADGSVLWHGFASDVTERKHIEFALRDSELRLREITARIPGAVYQFRLAPDGRMTMPYASESILDVLRLTPAQLHADGSTPLSYIDAGLREHMLQEIHQSARSLTRWHADLPMVFPDGARRWLMVEAMPVREADGATVWTSYIADITERKRIELELHESQERLRHLVARIPGVVFEFLLRPDGTFGMPYASPRAYELFGVTPEEMAADGIAAYRHLDPAAVERVMQAIMTSARDLTLWSQELPLLFPDGTRRWMHGESVPEKEPDGSIRWHGYASDVTERKQVEFALRDSERRLREITARIPGAVYQFRLAPNGSMTVPYASESIADVLHVSPEELQADGTATLRYVDPVERERVVRSIRESARTLGLWEQELPLTFADGERRWVRTEAMPVREPDGATVWTGFSADVTERKRVELALQETDERLRRIAARIPGMVFEFRIRPDGSSSVPFASDAIRNLFGLTPDAVREDAAPAFARFAAEDAARLRTAIAASAVELTPVTGDYRLRDAHDRSRWVQIEAVPTREADGSVLWHGITMDIMALKQAEADVRREKAFVDALVQNLVTPTLVLDPDGTVRVWNRALEHLTGVRAEQVVGTREHGRLIYGTPRPMMADIILTGNVPEYADLYAQFKLLEGIPGGFYTENWFSTPNGRNHYVSGAAAPVYYEDGSLAAVVQTIHDLTDKQHLQVELERARDEALSATRTKSAFLANMSHEIRTPMNGVIGMTGLLLGTVLDAEQREYAETIRVSGEHLLGIINDILDFSRIEAGRLELEIIDFDLWQVLEEVAAALALRAHERGLDFACFAEAEVPARLRGDPVRLRQMLINLVGNAIKFTLEGEVTARATLTAFTDSGATIRFEVRDTGIGIAPERVGDLFNAFTQADASTTRRFGGSGLGLAICKELAALMGGDIGVDSQPGRGSTFWFTVTLGRQPAELADATGGTELQGLRVLVVDDHATNRRLLEVLLGRWGCLHAEAAGGAEALVMLEAAAARGEAFDVALLDMQMPAMDGRQLARRIKGVAALAATQLVLLTSMGQDLARQLEPADFAASLTKPLRQSTLYDCIAGLRTRGVLPARAHSAPPSAAARDVPQRSERLLLVEDNAVNQKVAVGLLRKLGYRVDVVGDGASALEALTRTAYDLVFMDCQMPIMDGFAATRAIRDAGSAVRRHDIPVVAMTANVLSGDREACIAAGMNDFLPKPISPGALAHMLDKWLAPLALPPAGGAAPDGAAAKVFDRERLLDNVMGDEDLAREVLTAFAQDAEVVLTELGAALAAGDAQRSMRACHTLKGTTANVGAQALFALARRVEAAARDGDLAAVASVVPEFEGALAAFHAHAARVLVSGCEPSGI